MRRRKMRTLAKRYWRTTGLDVSSWRPRDSANWERIHSMPPGLRGPMIRALLDTAPSATRVQEIGVGLFETYFQDDPGTAIRPFLEARSSELELELVLSGVWPSILEEYLAEGHRIPLPAKCIAHLLEQEPESRDAHFLGLAERLSSDGRLHSPRT